MNGLPQPGPDGTISIPIRNKAEFPANQPIEAADFNDDPEFQSQLQAEQSADGLDSVDALADGAIDLLSAGEDSNIEDVSGMSLSEIVYTGTSDDEYENAAPAEVQSTSGTSTKRDATPARAVPDAAPVAYGLPRHSLRRRNFNKRDATDTFFEVMGNDFVGEICEVCGAM